MNARSVPGPTSPLDDFDRRILSVLRHDGRASVAEIGRQVGLSAAPVSRRIRRLEREGVILKYVAIVNEGVTGELDAFTEVRLQGATETVEIERIAQAVPEIKQVFTIAGDPDALIRFRIDSVEHLQRVVNAIRSTGIVAGTKTLIVMTTWDRDVDG